MTPAEIIYHRRLAVLDHARETRQRGRGLPGLRHLSDPLLRVEGRGRPLRPRRPDAQGAPGAPDARRHPHPRRRGRCSPWPWSSRPSAVANTPIASVTRASPSPSRPCRGTWWPTASARRAQRLARAAAIAATTTGLGDRGGQGGRALRVLPGHRGPGRARLPGQLLHRQAQGRGQGVPAHRHRRLHPLGHRGHRPRPGQRHPHHALHRPGASRTTDATGSGSGPCSATTGPSTWPRASGPTWRPRDLAHERIPPRSPNHNAVCERFHGTILQECWRPAFHRRHFTSIRQLQAEADAWLITYHHRRRNHGDYMRGRTPHQVLDNHKQKQGSMTHHQPQSPSVTSTLGPEALDHPQRHPVQQNNGARAVDARPVLRSVEINPSEVAMSRPLS